MKHFLTLCTFLVLIPFGSNAQIAEKQVSFAMETKPHSYYVKQAELWWEIVQSDTTNEDSWYNYFRACRNAQGTVDWKEDFYKETKYLRSSSEIYEMITANIPNTFTYYYLSYLKNGIGSANGSDILRAYKLRPDFPGIHSSVISYAQSINDFELRKKLNKEWYPTNYLSYQLLVYGYNLLMSLEENAIIFLQSDNDTYPVWMLQDALGIRQDVTVLNVDFFLLDDYRNNKLKELGIPALEMEVGYTEEYHLNWQKVMYHVLKNHNGERPLYLGMTLFNELYKDFEDELTISGLAFKHTKQQEKLLDFNKHLYEDVFMLDYLKHSFYTDPNQVNVNYQNLNYYYIAKQLYDYYKEHGKINETVEIKELYFTILDRIGSDEYAESVKKQFK